MTFPEAERDTKAQRLDGKQSQSKLSTTRSVVSVLMQNIRDNVRYIGLQICHVDGAFYLPRIVLAKAPRFLAPVAQFAMMQGCNYTHDGTRICCRSVDAYTLVQFYLMYRETTVSALPRVCFHIDLSNSGFGGVLFRLALCRRMSCCHRMVGLLRCQSVGVGRRRVSTVWLHGTHS